MPLLITELLSESVQTEVDARELLPSKTARSDDIKGFGRSGAGFGRPLPRSVHLPFIIDAVLREAPFVTGKRMQTWRSIIQSQDFQNLSVDSFWWFHANVIEPRDRGVDIGESTDIDEQLHGRNFTEEDALFSNMAFSYVHIFRKVQTQHKDSVINKFYEVMAYTILLILGAAYPRRRDHFLEDQALKRHLVDLCAEWTMGIQPRGLDGTHWIIKGDSHNDRKHGVLPKTKQIPKSALGNESDVTARSTAAHTSEHRNALRGVEPRVRASYSLLHSPFFCRFLSENATESRALQFRLGLTMEASRVTPFLNNHVPEDERSILHRKIKRAIRSASKPMPVDYLLSNSSVLRRSAMDQYSKQKQDATKAIAFFNRERRKITAQIEVEQRSVLGSENLREYATKLAKGYSQAHE
mmetsp:Transcript_32536/g.105771  ORF Transcript_32536/g.105771 Transcript_32536/m.105771 type:complete len:411 (-) Transcript_32536:227-1459(-)